MICAAAVTAQFVGGKATRDALFLTSHDVTALPTMLIVTAACSLAIVALHARGGRRFGPAAWTPISFGLSGALFVAEWALRSAAPSAVAVTVYLHVGIAGPLLASTFWLIASESFNPRTARDAFGRISAAGTIGGVLGALLSERVAAATGTPSMLLVLAGFQFGAAWLVRRLALSAGPGRIGSADVDPLPVRSGLRVISETPALRHVAALVLLGATGATLLDYVFKAAAVESFGPGDQLLRFFALYYAGTSLLSFLLQVVATRPILERFGLGFAAAAPSIASAAGILANLLLPGFGSLLIARGGESIFRASWFRSGYELFFTPIAAPDKRAAKSVIDIAFDRLGDAVGGGFVRLVTVLAPALQIPVILVGTMATSLVAVLVASRLNRWYVRSLERNLVNRGRLLDLSETHDGSTAFVVNRLRHARAAGYVAPLTDATTATHAVDAIGRDINVLRSQDRRAILQVLSRDEALPAALVAHVIPLLASRAMADFALFALRKGAEEHVGQLTDALASRDQPFEIRQQLVRVFSVCVSQRAADGLLNALEDVRFDVRCEAARSLAAIVSKNPRVTIDPRRIYRAVLDEVAVERPVWEGRSLLDGFASESPFDEFVRDRAGQSLAHVFTLLSLVLPRDPLRIAFRSLQSGDAYLRGTALEYLEGVLPAEVRAALWPFLVRGRRTRPEERRETHVVNLLRSSESPTVHSLAVGWSRERLASGVTN